MYISAISQFWPHKQLILTLYRATSQYCHIAFCFDNSPMACQFAKIDIKKRYFETIDFTSLWSLSQINMIIRYDMYIILGYGYIMIWIVVIA